MTDALNRSMNISEYEKESKSKFKYKKEVQESSAGYTLMTRSTNPLNRKAQRVDWVSTRRIVKKEERGAFKQAQNLNTESISLGSTPMTGRW